MPQKNSSAWIRAVEAGFRDPPVWSVFGSWSESRFSEQLRRITMVYLVDFEGNGELLKVLSRPQDGSRDIKVDDASGLITTETYGSTPSSTSSKGLAIILE
jgi:hypothetical protein